MTDQCKKTYTHKYTFVSRETLISLELVLLNIYNIDRQSQSHALSVLDSFVLKEGMKKYTTLEQTF